LIVLVFVRLLATTASTTSPDDLPQVSSDSRVLIGCQVELVVHDGKNVSDRSCVFETNELLLYIYNSAQRAQTLSNAKISQIKVIRNLNPDFPINPDPDVCRITP